MNRAGWVGVSFLLLSSPQKDADWPIAVSRGSTPSATDPDRPSASDGDGVRGSFLGKRVMTPPNIQE